MDRNHFKKNKNLEYEAKLIPGKKYPLSIGIKEAKHEVVLLTDADCMPATEFWMQKMQPNTTRAIDPDCFGGDGHFGHACDIS